MLKRKAIRKIIITTFSILTIFIICIMPNNITKNDLSLTPPIETTYVNNLETYDVYLLNSNNYLVKTQILLNNKKMEEIIAQIIEYLTINNSGKIPNGLSPIIPNDTELKNIEVEDKVAILDFNSKLLDINQELEERLVEALTFSLINIDGIEGIKIKIDGIELTQLPNSKKNLPPVLNRNIGINKVFEIENIQNIEKVVLYYIDNIENKNYYVPVTKYLNDDREKIKIIIENLSGNYIYEPSLISLVNSNTELIDYDITEKTMRLNFNQEIFTNNQTLEETTYLISKSVFENYDLDKVIFQIEGKNIKEIENNRVN